MNTRHVLKEKTWTEIINDVFFQILNYLITLELSQIG